MIQRRWCKGEAPGGKGMEGKINISDQYQTQIYCRLLAEDTSSPTLHHCIAAYISDSAMLATALLPHLKEGEITFAKSMILSLDHSIWIHRPDFRVDDWLLYEIESTVAG